MERGTEAGYVRSEVGKGGCPVNPYDLKWSPSENKAARSAFDAALESALSKAMAEFKRRAEAATTPSDMWEIESYLRQQRREFDQVVCYRYSHLPLFFSGLRRPGQPDEHRP